MGLSLSSGVSENGEKMSVLAVLYNSGLDTSLGHMLSCRSLDVDWQQWKSSCRSYDFSMDEVADVPLRSDSSIRRRNANCKFFSDCILSA